MAFLAIAKLSPTARLILSHLEKNPKPQSAIDISDAIGSSYWTIRDLCQALVQQGKLSLTLRGRSPHYSLIEPTKTIAATPNAVAVVEHSSAKPFPLEVKRGKR
jgi:hypothetical protein